MWGGWRGADHIPEVSATEVQCAGPSCKHTVEPYPSGLLPWSKDKPWRQVKFDEHEGYINLCSDLCEKACEEKRDRGNYG